MDLEEKKKNCLKEINEVEAEAKILLKRLEKARNELPYVKTWEDAERFSDENDIEEGFEHIQIF